MRRLGIEVDEALLGNGIYEHGAAWYSWHISGMDIPVMLLTYVGALKTWLYNPLFALWPPGPVSLRLPMVLVGAVTIVLFFLLLDRSVGRRAAWIGAALLATDASFVLTEAIDLGFVALQQCFKLGALLLLLSFHRTRRWPALAGGFFLFGLATWDKAVFVWIIGAVAIAGAVVFRREITRLTTVRNVPIALAAFLTGALPWVIYNVARPLETFTQNAHLTPDNPQIKLILLKRTIDGSGLFGIITAPDAAPSPSTPRGLIQTTAFAAARVTGDPRTSLIGWGCVIAMLVSPFVWSSRSRRMIQFSLLYLVITWLLMFVTTGAGGAVHHVILLWPFHLAIAAAVLSELAGRLGQRGIIATATFTVVLCTSNLLLLDSYFVTLIRDGTGVRWTDAFEPLTAWLTEARSPAVFGADWGILETLNLLSEGELPVQDASFALRPPNETQQIALLTRMLASPGALWVTHSAGAEQWTGVRLNLSRIAESLGYSQEVLHTVHDRHGRPIFDILRFRRAA